MLNFTLMLFTEEVLKSSPLPEESTMPQKWLPVPDSKNQYTFAILPPHQMLWTEFTNASHKEEELSSQKSQSKEPPYLLSKPTSPSLNLSDSLPTLDPSPQDKPSHNASSHIGISSTKTHSMSNQKPTPSPWESEKEKDSNKNYPTSTTISINSKYYYYLYNRLWTLIVFIFYILNICSLFYLYHSFNVFFIL